MEEAAVVTFAAAGDSEAFAELVRRFQNRVRNFLRRLCSQPDLADDLAQQVFLRTWKSINQLRSPDAFWSWLRKICISVWLEEVRCTRLAVEVWDENMESAESTSDGLTDGTLVDLNAALGHLSPPVRLCVVLAYGDGMSHPEISAATGIPLGTVKSHISRGASKMRELLADYRKQP